MTEKEILDGLNPEQIEAVTHDNGPLLLVAGAGTGKTTVITKRLAWLIFTKKATSEEILALTFTEKAAQEMEERVDRLLPYGYVDLWVSTFHSFGQRILEENALEIGLDPSFKVITPVDAWQMMRKNLNRFELNYYKPLGSPTKFLRALTQHFSRLKDEDVKPDEYLKLAEKKNTAAKTEEEKEIAEKMLEVARAYSIYEKIKEEEGLLDFGDLIIKTLELFTKRKSILEKYRQKFKYILVDEFQDTNWAQYELLRLLAAPANNLTVTGDDDQCLPTGTLIRVRNGSKKIEKIKRGSEVVTAVGRGYLAYSRVNRVFKNRKKARLLTFITKRGYRVRVTDNHKMFCFTPRVSDRKFYYVYLMKKEKLGWRLGITEDLAHRLKLERSADKILGIKVCRTEEEARFYETLFSLKYNIPTSCFMERDGLMIKGKWVEKLYKEIDVEKAVLKILSDLKISPESHHYSLGGVVRGNQMRIKINLEMCFRNYKSKYAKNYFLTNPWIRHRLHLETSHLPTIRKLRKASFKLVKAKKGFRLRMESTDLERLGRTAKRIQKITNGILECEFGIGKTNIVTQKALVIPASNVLPGLFLPVVTKKGVIYDQVLKVEEEYKNTTVYDLEVERSHNFVANGVIVHNSLYRWRGAAYTNLIQFSKDYPQTKIIVLKTNYRNKQNILDLSYKFIQLNNPDRLEAQLANHPNKNFSTLTKNLNTIRHSGGIIEHLHFKSQDEEADGVIKKIIELKKKNRDLAWSDFAILVRANDYAASFIERLTQTEIPFQFIASRGLYRKPEIMDLIAFLKLLDNYHESSAFYRFVSLPIFKFDARDLINLMQTARKKNWSSFETFERVNQVAVSPEAKKEAEKVLRILRSYTEMAKKKSVGQVLYHFIESSGLLKIWTQKDDQETIDRVANLRTFFKKIEEFSRTSDDKSIKAFMAQIELELEAGEEGALRGLLEEGPETVKVMTIHQAKGLEFPYVFIVNLVDKRFPSMERGEPIEMAPELIRETLPEGDYHLQEERRIFYVAMTRARDGLFFTSADDYGGTRKKKPSRFLQEIGLVEEAEKISVTQQKLDLSFLAANKEIIQQGKNIPVLPQKFSFTQLMAFEICPRQYKYAHILGVPGKPKYHFSFGHSIHYTLRDFYQLYSQTKKVPTLEKLFEIYENNWIDEWFESKEDELKRKESGRQALIKFYKNNQGKFKIPKYIEQPFNIKISDYILRGVIDRIDVLEKKDGRDAVEIIDYKTGQAPKTKADIDLEQLLIYALAMREVFHDLPKRLTYYYIEAGEIISIDDFADDLATIKDRILQTIEKIFKSDFTATPNPWKCRNCDFREICEDRQL